MVDASLSFARLRPRWTPEDRRRVAILAGSVAFHAAVLTPLMIGLLDAREDRTIDTYDPSILIQLEPRPIIPGETAHTPAPAAQVDATPAVGTLIAGARVAPAFTATADTPAPPSPHIAATPPAGAPAVPADPWQVTAETMRAAVARSLRTGPAGCRTMEGRLTPGEQQLCDDRFNEAAARARPLGPRTLDGSEARREAQFAEDGARAMAAHDRLRAPMRAGVGVSGASPECVGGNLRGTCAGVYLRPEYQHSEDAPFGGTAGPK